MASSSEDLNGLPGNQPDDGYSEDSRLEGKKKKSKPFRKLRNFFRGSSKKRFKGDDDVNLKAHSISALHTKNAEEDDDGGFKRVSVGLAGSRSISEDSIFKPEQIKEPSIGVLHGTAVSMERINSDFQSELFSKLKGRQLTDSDIDDGLPNSPPSTLTTADVLFGGGLSKSVPAGGKSTSLESDRSLLSIDGSETEEDLFESNWKSAVASVSTKRPSSSGSQSDGMEVSDLDVVERRTEKLSNEVAKHRISVKPKSRRAATKTSMRQKEKPQTVTQLPGVKEESPTKITVGEASDSITDKTPNVTKISTTISVGNPNIPRSEPKDIPQPKMRRDETDTTKSRSMSPLSTSPLSSSMIQDVKLRPRPASGKFDGVEVKPGKEEGTSELSNAFNKAKRFSKKFEDEVNSDLETSTPNNVTKEEPKFGITLKGVSSLKGDKKSPSEEVRSIVETKSINEPVKDTNLVSQATTGVSFVLKKEPLRPTASKQEFSEAKNGGINATEKKEVNVSKTVTISGSKQVESNVSNNFAKSDIVSPSKVIPSRGQTGSPEKLASPREDYKQKRQLRSKTLPEQPVPKEMLDKAKEADSQKPPVKKLGSPPLSAKFRGHDYDNVTVGTKAIQSKRASWAPETTSTRNTSAEPIWIAKARQKQVENERQTSEKDNKETYTKTDVDKNVDKTVTQTTVKIAERPAPQSNVATTSEKKESLPSKSLSPTVNVGEKSNVQTNVKSWTQAYSAKPFEKSSTVSSVKSSVQAKSVTEKPVNVQVKPSVPASSSIKPNIQSTSRPSFDKSITASTKETVEKPVSVSATKSGFDRTGSQKPSTVTAKPAFDSRSVTQSNARPLGSANTIIPKEPVKGSITPVSKEQIKSTTTSDTKKSFGVETKKVEEKKDIKSTTGGFSARPGNMLEKKTPDAGGVPAWKQKKNSASQVKIEIIDKTDSKADQNKSPERKVEEKKSVVQAREKAKTETCSDSAANRSSRVLDMVKNFQKLQVT